MKVILRGTVPLVLALYGTRPLPAEVGHTATGEDREEPPHFGAHTARASEADPLDDPPRSGPTTRLHTRKGTPHSEPIIFAEDFDAYPDGSILPAVWWCEGSSAVSIENGRLRADANPDGSGEDHEASTIWLNRKFQGNLQVEFNAHVLASKGDKNNINFFLLFSDPSGKALIESRDDRADAKYSKYHELNGYVFTFLANGNPNQARFRLRDDPGFNLLLENNAYECKRGKTYHIVITKKGNRITYAVDGKVYLDCGGDSANPEHKAGSIGFRTWRTDLWWDNLKVIQLR